jgi:hypothetical protein
MSTPAILGTLQRARPHPLRAAAGFVAAAASLAACAAPQPSPLIGLRPTLGGLSLASAPGAPPELSAVPAKGGAAGALAGAGEGLKLGGAVAISGGLGGDPRLLLFSVPLGLATAIVTTPAGAVIGAAKARSKAEVEAAEAAIRKALADAAPHPRLAEAMRGFPALAPNLKTDEIAAAGDYRALGSRGVGTVVEVTTERYGLVKVGIGASDPDFRLALKGRVRLVRAADNAELYSRVWHYVGPSHAFFAWAERDGALVRAELDRAYRGVAARLARHLFTDREPTRAAVIAIVSEWRPPRRGPSPPPVTWLGGPDAPAR